MSKKREAPPRWLKLDNAAKIYPPSRSRNWAAMFRVSATLDEVIDPAVLKRAQDAVLRRMPTFAYRLRRGVFWYFMERMPGGPDVQRDVGNPLVRMDLNENRHFMFRVRYYEKRIAVEVFHALTDGTGAMTFLMTLVAEYLRQRCGARIEPGGMVLDIKKPASAEELEDSFLKYARDARVSRAEAPAYSVRGTRSALHHIGITTGMIPVDALKRVAKEYGASVTVLLASVLIMSIADIQRSDPSGRRRRQMIKVSVPVNLRPFYRSVTLRNFASYINTGILSALGEFCLEEIITQVRHQLGMEITEKGLNARFSANVSSERSPLVRLLPLFLKAPFLKMMFLLQGDRYCSSTLTNLGLVTLPEGMIKRVERVDFMLGAPGVNPVVAAAVSYKGQLVINFSSRIEERDVERGFFTRLIKLGVPVKVESNRRW